MIKLIVFDLDGTLTQHKTKLSQDHRIILEKLQSRYKLVMVGAGQCGRVFEKMNHFPIDIIGNYGMGGNDKSVYVSDFGFITIDNYLDFPERVKSLLE